MHGEDLSWECRLNPSRWTVYFNACVCAQADCRVLWCSMLRLSFFSQDVCSWKKALPLFIRRWFMRRVVCRAHPHFECCSSNSRWSFVKAIIITLPAFFSAFWQHRLSWISLERVTSPGNVRCWRIERWISSSVEHVCWSALSLKSN